MSYISRLVSRDTLFVAFLSVLCTVLFYLPTGFENRLPQNALQARGLVLTVDNSTVQQFGIVKAGDQGLTVRILDGRFKGKEVTADNQLIGKMELDKMFKVGDIALLSINHDGDKIVWANASNHYRNRIELALLLLFGFLLVMFAGWTGVKALISFLFTALMIWKVMIPSLLRDYDPILLSLVVVGVLTAAIIFLVAGLTTKGVVAFLGASLGLLLTCILAQIFCPEFRLHGAVRPFSETLLYSGFPHLNLTRIFLAGIFTAASGAVMDLAMDISASMNEVVQKRPDISFREAVGSGFAVGRAVIGTMTTTLLLAYSGGYITMLMVFMAQGVPLINIFNINYVAAEILHTLVGSFGLITVAPFTAVVGAFLYVKGERVIGWKTITHTMCEYWKLMHPNALFKLAISWFLRQ